MRRIRKISEGSGLGAGSWMRAALVSVALAACGGETLGGPEGPDTSGDSTPSVPETPDRALPEGTYELTLRACERCVPGSMPDYMLAFAEGASARITIMAATESTASVGLLEMRGLGETPVDLLGLFEDRIIRLAWDGPDGVFRGFVEYGTAALFVASLHLADGELECDFDLVHLKHDVGATSCSITD